VLAEVKLLDASWPDVGVVLVVDDGRGKNTPTWS
jgi:hypothetical protein